MKDHFIQKIVVQARLLPKVVLKHSKRQEKNESLIKEERTAKIFLRPALTPLTLAWARICPLPRKSSSPGCVSPSVPPALPSGSSSSSSSAQPPSPPPAKTPTIMRGPGELVKNDDFDPDRLPNGCIFQHERVTRKRKLDRHDNIPPELSHATSTMDRGSQ